LLEALSNTKTIEAEEEAQDLLEKTSNHKVAAMSPDVVSFTTVLLAWVKLGEG